VSLSVPSATADSQAAFGQQSEAAFSQFLAWLRSRWGLDWSSYRPDYLQRRIGICMSAAGIRNYAEYVRRLERDPQALDRLRNDITVNVTEFLRDAPTFAAFRSVVIPQVVATKQKAGTSLVRTWSAGCASGEEPYSIALCFLEALGRDLGGLWVCVHATDIDEDSLQRARAGVYPSQSLKNVPPALAANYFRERPDGARVVGETLRGMLRFQRLDLLNDEPLKHVDIIFCRYVFIYFSRELQERAIRSFHQSLNNGGFLVLGRTETMPPALLDGEFVTVDSEERIYQKSTA